MRKSAVAFPPTDKPLSDSERAEALSGLMEQVLALLRPFELDARFNGGDDLSNQLHDIFWRIARAKDRFARMRQ